MFNELGYGISATEALRIMVGLRQVLRSEPLAQIRWWGKVHGVLADYYIAEGKVDEARLNEMGYGENNEDGGGDVGDGTQRNYYDDEDESENEAVFTGANDHNGLDYNNEGNSMKQEEDEDDEDESGVKHETRLAAHIARVLCPHVAAHRHPTTPPELANTGVNEFVYFAASSSDPTTWTRLPRVRPHHIDQARRICVAFTGNLQTRVQSHPRFIGRERHYLRAQIARITHGCRIAPRQIFTT